MTRSSNTTLLTSARGLPVLVHVVSQRAWILGLRRTERPLAFIVVARGAFLSLERVGILKDRLFEAR
jgi:hypothetical protein